MRFIILGMSVIFFTLSVIITFKALGLPAQKISFQDEWGDVTSESGDAIKKSAENQDANTALVADLQATIARLEDQLTTKEQVPEDIVTTDDENRPIEKEKTLDSDQTNEGENKPRVLAIFGGGTFSSGGDVINDIDFSTIENLVREISASPGSRVIIEGHTDNTQIRSYPGMRYSDNMGLSLLRARAIANLLVRHGISLDQMSVIGYGETRPIDVNYTEEGRAKNRRVEVKLVPEEREG